MNHQTTYAALAPATKIPQEPASDKNNIAFRTCTRCYQDLPGAAFSPANSQCRRCRSVRRKERIALERHRRDRRLVAAIGRAQSLREMSAALESATAALGGPKGVGKAIARTISERSGTAASRAACALLQIALLLEQEAPGPPDLGLLDDSDLEKILQEQLRGIRHKS